MFTAALVAIVEASAMLFYLSRLSSKNKSEALVVSYI